MSAFTLTGRLRPRTFLLLCALALAPLCLLGYGADNDIYTVLDAGRSTWRLHEVTTSRNPGYWVFEAMVFALSTAGGYLATNFATLAAGVACLWRLQAIAARLGVQRPLLLAASLAATPAFAIAATSTDDYLWSLLGLVVFAELIIAGRLPAAVVPAALAFSIRGANGPLIAGAILGAMWAQRRHGPSRWLQLAGTGLAAAVLGGLPYFESYRLAGHSWSFTHALAGPDSMWTFKMRAGRFAYKSLYLFGPAACLAGLAALVRGRTDSRPAPEAGPGRAETYRARAVPVFLGIIAANFVLFFAYPIEISYLLPAAFFLLPVLGLTALNRRRAFAVAFFLAVLSLDLVTPQLAQPNISGHATEARLRPALRRGVLIDDIRFRLALRRCDDYLCYLDVASAAAQK